MLRWVDSQQNKKGFYRPTRLLGPYSTTSPRWGCRNSGRLPEGAGQAAESKTKSLFSIVFSYALGFGTVVLMGSSAESCLKSLLHIPIPFATGSQAGRSGKSVYCFGNAAGLTQAHATNREKHGKLFTWAEGFQVTLGGFF